MQVPQELGLGTLCSWDLGIRRKGTAQLVMVLLKGPVISEQNLILGQLFLQLTAAEMGNLLG